MQLQEKISARRLARKIGSTVTVLVDGVNDDGAVARSSADAPEIDGQVYIEQSGQLKAGDFVDVCISRADAHDLWAEVI